jgi:hypothetical protein
MENRRSAPGDRDGNRGGGNRSFQSRDSRPQQTGGGDWFSQAMSQAKKK